VRGRGVAKIPKTGRRDPGRDHGRDPGRAAGVACDVWRVEVTSMFGPVGTVWASGTWALAWGAGTWADAHPVPPGPPAKSPTDGFGIRTQANPRVPPVSDVSVTVPSVWRSLGH